MKYFLVTRIVEIPESEYESWDSRCDETFAIIRTTEGRLYAYTEIHTAQDLKFYRNSAVETEEGGI